MAGKWFFDIIYIYIYTHTQRTHMRREGGNSRWGAPLSLLFTLNKSKRCSRKAINYYTADKMTNLKSLIASLFTHVYITYYTEQLINFFFKRF